jgi:hypothetical protein
MWKIYKLFLVLLPGEKVYWAGTNALKLMGNRYNIFAEDSHTLGKNFMIILIKFKDYYENTNLLL